MTSVQVGIWGASRNVGRRLSRLLREEGEVMVTLRPDVVLPSPETLPHLLILFGPPDHLREQVETVRATAGGEQVVLVAALTDTSQLGALDELLGSGIDDLLDVTAPSMLLKARLRLLVRRARARQRRWDIERELQVRVGQQAVVAELGRRALANVPLPLLLEYATERVAAALGVELAKVLRLLPEEQEFLLVAGYGWQEGVVGTFRVPAGTESQAGYTLRAGSPIVVEDFAQERRFACPELLRRHGVQAGLSVPIFVGGHSWGVLGAHTCRPRTFAHDDVHFMQAVAHVLATAIERRTHEEALRESEARYRAIVETAVDAIITIDETGRILLFNPAAERIFGYRAEEVIGQNISVLMPSPYREQHDRYIRNYLETGRRRIIGRGREVTGQRKDGTTFPMYLAVSEVRLPDRRLFTGIVRDLSETRRLEQEILRISDEERRSIGQDLHDGLGQMLTGMALISQSLARRLAAQGRPEARELEELTELIRQADQQARTLARGLIPVELEANGLQAALHRLARQTEQLFGIRCRFQTEKEVPVADNLVATHLYRIAQEALNNAVRHGQAQRITVTLKADDEALHLWVRDDGVGIPDKLPETRGMGLRIMHYRARLLGGHLEIRRRAEGGTEVHAVVPLSGRVLPADASQVLPESEVIP
ncbi:PAS domain S-box protein [Rhodothermus profundi]|uniref:Sensor protein FixL n=1 Tax=Rhodothermus profundi TaxID=633813 RepID=A0A1M6QCN6_9BACT|nr:PAS domain S-box protein [Rhodothermus profundi]SHK17833.1 PAS domain S-box-containing protein [Rhodothermus profundi]